MNAPPASRIPSLVKKYLMAVTGLVLALFVFGHMAGNLQIFSGTPETMNHYARFLHSVPEALWLVRLILLACVVVHIWMAVLLTIENRRARAGGPAQKATVQASYASRTMFWSGLIVLAFILFHLAHYTVLIVHPIFKSLVYVEDGRHMHDVYAMVLVGFSYKWVALFYVIAVGLLCIHLSHGASSMFQSLGLRNEKLRARMNRYAAAFGVLLFLGFSSIPVAVQYSLHAPSPILPVKPILAQIEKADQSWDPTRPTPVQVNYHFAPGESASADASR